MLRCSLSAITAVGAVIFLFSLVTLYRESLVSIAPDSIVNGRFLQKSNLMDVKNETLGFARIFANSLPERSDKRDALSLVASVTDVQFDWMDGVDGASVPEKAKPETWPEGESNFTLGCWRAHMNSIQRIVKEEIPTALILEDDADWDVHLKAQLLEFARGTRYLLNQTDNTPTHSPYGDGWDALWLGHCGARNRENEDQNYYVIRDDPTAVPLSQWGYPRRQPNFKTPKLNGNWSRVVYEPTRGLCMFGYALTLKGAQQLLYSQVFEEARVSDRALNNMCDRRVDGFKCFLPFPTLIGTHKAAGKTFKDSDREDTHMAAGGYRETGVTGQIVFSVRLNLKSMVKGARRIFRSQWPSETMVDEIDGDIEIPRGEGVFVAKGDYDEFKRPN